MKHRHGIVFALALGLIPAAWSAPASACRVASAMMPLLHETLDPETTGDFAAEVEIVADKTVGSEEYEFRARVIKVLRGEFTGTTVFLRPLGQTSCDADPSVGQKGIVVGTILSISPEELVLDPIRALSQDQRARLKAKIG